MTQNQNLSAEFMALLNQTAEEYRTSTASNDWMPPDGDYTVVISNYTNGMKTGDSTFAWFKLEGRIDAPQNPEVHDKVFALGFATTKYPGLLKTLVNAVAGVPVDNIADVHPTLQAAVGKIANVNVSTKLVKKTGNQVRNVTILGLV